MYQYLYSKEPKIVKIYNVLFQRTESMSGGKNTQQLNSPSFDSMFPSLQLRMGEEIWNE
jgi:hypothetical protein